MIKILHTLPDLHVGGVASLLVKILENFEDDIFEHHLCYFGENEALLNDFQEESIIIHRVNHRGVSKLFHTCKEFNKLVKNENIDIIHNHLFLDRTISGLCSFFNKAAIITSIHTTNSYVDKKTLKEKAKALFEDMLGKISSQKFIAVSDAVKVVAVQERFVATNKVSTIYSGVKIPERITREINTPVKLISIGRLIESKGFFDLINMMDILSKKINIHLNILGDGPLRPQLEGKVKSLQLENYVRFSGFSDEVHKHLEQSDIFVSCSREEGFGLSLVEAMSFSLPVCAYSIPIFKEISGADKVLKLTDVGNVECLAENILDLVQYPDKYENMSNKSYRRANNVFDIQKTAENYLILYKNISNKN